MTKFKNRTKNKNCNTTPSALYLFKKCCLNSQFKWFKAKNHMNKGLSKLLKGYGETEKIMEKQNLI